MKLATQIAGHIKRYYRGSYPNYVDLAEHLKRGRIDSNEPVPSCNGFDRPHSDYLPCIFHYMDGSMLIVTNSGVIAVEEAR